MSSPLKRNVNRLFELYYGLLIQEQVALGKDIERLIINYKKDSPDRKTKQYLESRLETANHHWTNFDRGHRALLTIGADNSDYFTSQYYERVRDGINAIVTDIREQLKVKWGVNLDAPLNSDNQPVIKEGGNQPSISAKAPSNINPQSGELMPLVRRQRALINALKRLLQDIEGRLSSPNSSIYYQVKIDAVSKYWNDIAAINQSIWSDSDEPELLGYDIDAVCNTEAATQDVLIKLKELLQARTPPPRTVHAVSSAPIKLPKITIPVFDGNYLEWKAFSGLYRRLIHDQPINQTEKMFYLMSNLAGEAKRLVQHFPVSESSYNSAWDTLVDRYDNQRMLVTTILNRLLGQPTAQLDSASSIRSLHDVTRECILGLEDLGISTTSWDAFLTHVTIKKLDRTSHALYEQTLEQPRQVQRIGELLVFLENRFQSLETLGKVSTPRNHTEGRTKGSSMIVSGTSACPICNLPHAVYGCPKFLKMDVKARHQVIRKVKHCINCLQHGHYSNQCTLGNCKRCSRKHNTLLHEEAVPDAKAGHNKKSTTEATSGSAALTTRVTNQITSEAASCSSALTSGATNSGKSSYVFLATAVIHIRDGHDKLVECRAVLDSGSQLNFISADLAARLQIPHTNCNTIVAGIGNHGRKAQRRLYTTIHSKLNNFSTGIEVVILPTITSDQPAHVVDIKHWSLPSNIKLADPGFQKPGKIDLLIGAEHFSELMAIGQIQMDKNLPTLQNTLFGWVVLGRITSNEASMKFCGISTEGATYADIQRIWELEQVSSSTTQPRTQAEYQCEKSFEENTSRDESGRFLVRLPFKAEPTVLGHSKAIAIRRFISLEKGMMKNPELRIQYAEFMSEYLKLGHMVKVDEHEIGPSHYVIPHHCILKPSSTTTKLRVVFDASCKTTTNISLNEILYKGPTLQDDLFTILTRFRLHKYVFTADIEKMYRQIQVNPADQKYQVIVYRSSHNDKIEFYKLQTLTYGTTSASYLATKCLQRLSEEARISHPLGAEVARRDFYMDDVMTGSNELSEALQTQAQLKGLLKGAGFNLRKWCSNHPMLLATVPDSDIEFRLDLDNKDDEGIKTLGLTWLPKTDQFSIQTNWSKVKKVTKRSILADIAHIFDPLGLINPVIVRSKIFLQHLWKLKLDWDAALPEELHTSWLNFRDELPLLNELKITRQACITTSRGLLQVHGFSDASEKAYGVAIYLRSIDVNGKVAVRLLCAASKVAPTKTITLPRLELCAAHMLAHMIHRVKEILQLADDQIFYWCDSKIVLHWIKAESSSYKTFVANRIAEIQSKGSLQRWKYVSTSFNPADLVSRGTSPKTLIQSDLWFNGPDFLRKSSYDWPSEDASFEDEQSDLKQTSVLLTTQQQNSFIHLIDHKNSFRRLTRIVAYVRRFTKNLQMEHKLLCPLTAEENHEALLIIVRDIQAQHFKAEFTKLTHGDQLDKRNKIASLAPFIDGNQIIRVGGRLQAANISFDTKHPMLLPRNHALTRLLVTDIHKENYHAGPQALTAIVRQRFWPLQGKLLARSVVQQCVRCVKARPVMCSQLMGNLPAPRIQQSRPFLHSGVDFCGPIQIHYKIRGKRPQKAYIAVFCCFSTKAIHLELVSDLTTESFLGALKRFFARRGYSRSIYCDNATNFLGAYNKLEEVKKMLQTKECQEDIASLCLSKGTDFHFIPPRTPHFGGIWEAGVKSAKKLLFKTIHPVSLTYEELETAIIEIEAILNSRPLTPLSSNPNDLTALTPGHFLTGEALTSIPEARISTDRPDLLTRWKLVQYVKTEFWKQWTKEYLSGLQQRTKWTHISPNITPGDLVIIKDDSLPPLQWHMGRVIKAIEGDDKLVRVADVRTATGVYRRPIHRLCLLPVHQEDTSSKPPEESNNEHEDSSNRTRTSTKHRSPTQSAPVDPGPKKRRQRIGPLSAISVLLLILFLPVGRSIQVAPFSSPPGLYFENVGVTNLITDEWKIVVYYNMTNYWKEGRDLADEVTKLGMLCKRPESNKYCSAIQEQLQHQFDQIQEQNKLLNNSEQSIRKRRAPLEIIGSIASSLFGLLDQDYAKELSQKIKIFQNNEARLQSMIQTQTLILESTTNILKKGEENIKEQFKHMDREIDSLSNQLHLQQLQQLTTSVAIHLSLIMQNYKNIQTALLDVLFNIHHGIISPMLITPQQLEAGMHMIRPHLPLTRRLPDYEDHLNILQLFRLMTLQGRATPEFIIAEIRIPLLTNERYDTFRITPVPMVINNTNAHVIPSTDMLIIDPHRDQYLPITIDDFSKCTQLFESEYFCKQTHPIFHKGSDQSRCEIYLLNKGDISKGVCNLIITDELRKWTPLHSRNDWIYSVNKSSTINIVCNDKLTQITLVHSGVLSIDSNCIIKDEHLTISSRNMVSTRVNNSYTPTIGHDLNFTANPFRQLSSKQEEYYPRNEEIAYLQEQLKKLKFNETASLEDTTQEVHQFSIAYSSLFLLLALAAYILWTRCTSKTAAPVPAPRNRTPPNQDFNFQGSIC